MDNLVMALGNVSGLEPLEVVQPGKL